MIGSKTVRWLALGMMVALAAAPTALWAQAAKEKAFTGPAPACPTCVFGGDIRIRQVYLDNIPIVADPPGVTRGGENHFFRFRTRLWGQWNLSPDVAIRGRGVNEFRHYETPDNNTMDAFDEFVVDNLYLDVKNLFDGKLDLRIGRQDLIYGTGKVILEGTPKDGSRTIYFDAIKASYKGLEKTTIDLLGIYDQPENELVLDTQNRDLTGQTSRYDDITESGGGVYLKNQSVEGLPLEAYYLYKVESDWTKGTGTNAVHVGELDLNTVGFRLMPKFTDLVSGNLETAYQFGDRGSQDVTGYLVDALVQSKVPALDSVGASVGAGLYYLSGDDPKTAKDEGWNPLWARWPQYSELYVYAYDASGAGRWSNVNMPHVDLNLAPAPWLKTKAMAAYLFAPEKDGPGGGDERGFLFTLLNTFTLGEQLFCAKDRLAGHLLLEILEPGDYYNVDATAVFARWQLTYAF